MTTMTCESCGMPLHTAEDHAAGRPDAPLCRLCTDESGQLQPFDERFERMVQWSMRQDNLDRATAEESTRRYMRAMPAWRDHPRLAQG
jgi:hypothetical protein